MTRVWLVISVIALFSAISSCDNIDQGEVEDPIVQKSADEPDSVVQIEDPMIEDEAIDPEKPVVVQDSIPDEEAINLLEGLGLIVVDREQTIEEEDGIQPEAMNFTKIFGMEPEEGWITEKGDFPHCQRGMKWQNGYIWGTKATTSREFGCAWDTIYKRNCSEIRFEGEYRVENMANRYNCVDGVPVYRYDSDSEKKMHDFSRIWRIGDCDEIIHDYQKRMEVVKRRLKCNDKGKAYEDYKCWGCAEGGRHYNPCAGGMC